MSTVGVFVWWGNGLILASGWRNIKRPEEEVEAKELCAGLHQTRILIQAYLESRNRDRKNREPCVMLRWKNSDRPWSELRVLLKTFKGQTEFLFSAHEVLRKERGLFEKYGNIQYNITSFARSVNLERDVIYIAENVASAIAFRLISSQFGYHHQVNRLNPAQNTKYLLNRRALKSTAV